MTWNRITSSLIALIYFMVAFVIGGGESVFKLFIFLVLPMTCIWFPDVMGRFEGLTPNLIFVSSSPAVLVRILGWVLLLLPMILGFYMYALG